MVKLELKDKKENILRKIMNRLMGKKEKEKTYEKTFHIKIPRK